MAMVLNAIILKCVNYITITMVTPPHGHYYFCKKNLNKVFFFFLWQTNPMLFTTMGFFLPLL